MSDVSEIPDKVIEEAEIALADAVGGLSRQELKQARLEFAKVIAAWARGQERERIRARLEDAGMKASAAYLIDSLTRDDLREATDERA